MRRLLIFVLVILALTAAPAQGLLLGAVCKTFPGPAGSEGTHLVVCAYIEDDNFTVRIRARANFDNQGFRTVTVHMQYLKLIKNGNDVNQGGSDFNLPGEDSTFIALGWHTPQDGATYHTRIRMWVCWPTIVGNPCGGAVAWNSGSVTA